MGKKMKKERKKEKKSIRFHLIKTVAFLSRVFLIEGRL
jgi:hypothetical protein